MILKRELKIVKGFKKFLVTILVCAFSNQFCCKEVNSLFINTHFNLGEKIIEQSGISLVEDEKNAFLSGMVYADIGRFKFDKETGVDSDSYKFAQEMKKYAKTSEEKWFVRGFEIHTLQDKETGKFLKKVFGCEKYSYLEYIMNCSLLDSYFLRKTGCYISNDFLPKFNFKQVSCGIDIKKLSESLGIPENKIEDFVKNVLTNYSTLHNKYQLVIYAELIKKTYASFGFKITLDDVYQQAANILGTFIITSNIVEKEISTDLACNIEVTSNELVRLCVSRLETDIVSNNKSVPPECCPKLLDSSMKSKFS